MCSQAAVFWPSLGSDVDIAPASCGEKRAERQSESVSLPADQCFYPPWRRALSGALCTHSKNKIMDASGRNFFQIVSGLSVRDVWGFGGESRNVTPSPWKELVDVIWTSDLSAFWASIGGPSAEDTLETFHHWASWLCANFMYIGIKK